MSIAVSQFPRNQATKDDFPIIGMGHLGDRYV